MFKKSMTNFALVAFIGLVAFAAKAQAGDENSKSSGNRYCTIVYQSVGKFKVLVNILNPATGKLVDSDKMIEDVSRDEAIKILTSRACG